MRRYTAALATTLAALALVLLTAAPAPAHAELRDSNPADESTIATGPSEVVLTFSEPMPEGFDSVAVVGPDERAYQTGDTTTDGTTVKVSVGDLGPAGQYRILYRVISDDGHPISGEIDFDLTTAGTGAGSEPDAATRKLLGSEDTGDDNADGGGSSLLWIVGAVGILGIGAAVGVRTMRRNDA